MLEVSIKMWQLIDMILYYDNYISISYSSLTEHLSAHNYNSSAE